MNSAPLRIDARTADLGEGMMVHRFLPTRQQRMIGAWCFLDHAGPVHFSADRGMHVGAHPHIGLQTFTWMIEGEVLHRDSLGNEQAIRPGQVNLMTAGHGISHTEDSLRDGERLHAAQLWIALPPGSQHSAPGFAHYPDLPVWQEHGASLTLLAGAHEGRVSPVAVHSPMIGLHIETQQDTILPLALNPAFEYGLLPMTGALTLEGERFAADEFAVLSPGRTQISLQLTAGSKVLLIGGVPFEQQILMWWNFVGYSKEEIATAQREWEQHSARFGQVGDGTAHRLSPPPLPWHDV